MLDATALWWRIQLDPDSRALDDEFSTSVERAIRTTEAWTVRAPDDAEAWFYLGGAYAARVQWRVLREERLAAARDGKRIKEALERALTLDPEFDDAYFGIGMYRYYADVAPTAAKILQVSPVASRWRPSRRTGADAARPDARAACSRVRRTTSCTSSISGTRHQTRRALELLRDLQKAASRAIRSS